jgi:hypothetical protein
VFGVIKFKFFLSVWMACYLGISGHVSAHTIEQFYASYENDSGVVVVNFDVAYAMPDVREDAEAPQPMRDWLVSLSDHEHANLKSEAELYLRSYLHFQAGGENVDFEIRFPDFMVTPYAFPKLMNAGAYYTVELIPQVAGNKVITLAVKDGEFPKLLVANKVNSEFQFNTLETKGSLELKDFLPFAGSGENSDELSEVSFSTWQLLILGFKHVIPDGLDHVFFMIGLCFIATSIKQLLWHSLTFTLAHSLSMVLVISKLLPIHTFWISGYIEAVIALSIAFIALESLVMKSALKWRYLVIFLFGFVHGLGFAGSLGSTLQFLSADHWLLPLLLANVGIEIAQAILVVASFSLLYYLKKAEFTQLEKQIRFLSAIAIAYIGLLWFFDRLP